MTARGIPIFHKIVGDKHLLGSRKFTSINLSILNIVKNTQ